MENVDLPSLRPSGSITICSDRLFVVDVSSSETGRIILSLNVEGCRLYDLIMSICSNGFMVSVSPFVEKV